MAEDWLDRELKDALGKPGNVDLPDFDVAMRKAEEAHRHILGRRRFRSRLAGVAAAAAVVAVVLFGPRTPETEPGIDFAIDDSLMTRTFWRAPSDGLMPEHLVDIYEPLAPVSTELLEGTLL